VKVDPPSERETIEVLIGVKDQGRPLPLRSVLAAAAANGIVWA